MKHPYNFPYQGSWEKKNQQIHTSFYGLGIIQPTHLKLSTVGNMYNYVFYSITYFIIYMLGNMYQYMSTVALNITVKGYGHLSSLQHVHYCLSFLNTSLPSWQGS